MGLRQLGDPLQGVRQPRAPRARIQEKIADAATVHRLTGARAGVALHIPWDRVDDYDALRAHAEEHGVALGTINSNMFQDDDYKLGAPDPRGQEDPPKAIDHHSSASTSWTPPDRAT